MMRFMFLLLPWLELLTLIEVGSAFGGLNAMLYVFLTLMFGLWLIRRQGKDMLLRLRKEVTSYTFGPQLLADDMAMVFSGLLLMVPGLITDIIGLLLIIGPLRRRLFSRLGSDKLKGRRDFEQEGSNQESITIDGDFHRIDD